MSISDISEISDISDIYNKPDSTVPDSAASFNEELRRSYAIVKRLLPFIASRGIPATPFNYRLFYDYLENSNPELNKVINSCFASNVQFSAQLAHNISDKFYNDGTPQQMKATHAMNKATSDFMSISNAMVGDLENIIIQTGNYHKHLTDSSLKMSNLETTGDIKPLLGDLLTETETALTTHNHFLTKLEEANSVITNLKAELKNQATLAQVDDLTKLYNRRFLNQEAPRVMATAAKFSLPLSLIIFDLDKFKTINDTWGHNFGDKVLVVCANMIKKMARNTDLAVRLGGEEFLLFCPGMSLAIAFKVADRIREAISELDLTIRGTSLGITISGGVAEYIAGEELSEIIERADKALYIAKEDGRNRIRMAGDCPMPEKDDSATNSSSPTAHSTPISLNDD